jgi:AraC family transcriptional regulator
VLTHSKTDRKAKAVNPEQRIEVLQDGVARPLLSDSPLLTSAGQCWEGFLLEEFATLAVFEASSHEHTSHVIHVHTGPPASVEWRTAGRVSQTRTVPGSASIAPQGLRHSMLMKRDEPGGLWVLEIEPAHLTRVVQDAKPSWKPELTEQLDVRDRQIELLATAMREDIRTGSPAGRLYGESLGTALAIYLAQRYASVRSSPSAYRGGMPPARLKRILEYIDANLDENLKLSDLATTVGVSLYHFAKLFKQSTSESPHRFVLRRRIERAKELLRNPEMSVLEVSVRTGFVDQRHFAKVFRRLVGANPSSYRAQTLL